MATEREEGINRCGEPIGIFTTRAVRPYEAPRQATLGSERGIIRLYPRRQYEQALIGLEEFERIWILYLFHHNLSHWKPMVQPPRSLSGEKYGLFATRAPYRPNPIGLSCTRLISVKGLTLEIEGSDLLDGTPILDIKPYIPYADAFPHAAAGWTDRVDEEGYSVELSESAARKSAWLTLRLNLDLSEFFRKHLSHTPTDSRHKRVRRTGEAGVWLLSLRTWRISFRIDTETKRIAIDEIYSGYLETDLVGGSVDPFGDKEIHRAFIDSFADGWLPARLSDHRHRIDGNG